MSTIFNIKQGDRLPVLRATLARDDGTKIDVTGATVRFFMSTVAGATPKINGSLCDIIDAANGVVEYVWGATDTSDAAQFRGEFEVTYADGRKETVPNDTYVLVDIAGQLG